MKLRMLLLSASLFCLLPGLAPMSGTCHAQAQNSITENKILAILESTDKAAKNKNVDGIVAHMAKDIQIKLILDGPANDQEINLDLEKYIFHTRRGFRKRIAYEYDRQNTRVTISKDGKTAMVTADLYETLTIAEGTIQSVTAEIAIFKLRDGKILITSLEGKLRLL